MGPSRRQDLPFPEQSSGRYLPTCTLPPFVASTAFASKILIIKNLHERTEMARMVQQLHSVGVQARFGDSGRQMDDTMKGPVRSQV